MRRPRGVGFTLLTSASAIGRYRGWERAVGNARSLAARTDGNVSLISDDSGASWEVTPDGRVTAAASAWRRRRTPSSSGEAVGAGTRP
jgi:hypothetical protein